MCSYSYLFVADMMLIRVTSDACSEANQSVSRDNNITDSKHVQYAAIETDPKPNMKPACDVKMDANPAYQATS